jgi:hypothetical protein
MDDFRGLGDYLGIGQPNLVDGYPVIGGAGGLPQSNNFGVGNPFPGLGGGTPGTFNFTSGTNGGGLGGLLSGLGQLGGSPGQAAASNAQASPASQPQGGGGMRNIQLPSPLIPSPGPPVVPGTGQPSSYLGPPPPMGPAAQNPLLMMLQQRLGMGG